MLSSTLLFAELPDLRRPVRRRSLPSRTCEVQTIEDASPNLPNILGTLNLDGNADSNRSGGKKFLGQNIPGNFGGKATKVTKLATPMISHG